MQFLGKVKTPAQWTHLKELTLNGRILCLAQQLPGLLQPDILSSLLAWEKHTHPHNRIVYLSTKADSKQNSKRDLECGMSPCPWCCTGEYKARAALQLTSPRNGRITHPVHRSSAASQVGPLLQTNSMSKG